MIRQIISDIFGAVALFALLYLGLFIGYALQ